jgi:hypothetical protein
MNLITSEFLLTNNKLVWFNPVLLQKEASEKSAEQVGLKNSEIIPISLIIHLQTLNLCSPGSKIKVILTNPVDLVKFQSMFLNAWMDAPAALIHMSVTNAKTPIWPYLNAKFAKSKMPKPPIAIHVKIHSIGIQ